LRRLVTPEHAQTAEAGRVIAFASSKPGSGASTIATQTAFALQRLTQKRILLVDCDLTGGTIGFYLKLSHSYSLLDALQHVEHLDPALWNSLTVNNGGVDILPAPALPYADPVDGSRLRALAEHARGIYDWVILDLPTVFTPTSLMAIAECECAFLVSTAGLPSLHLTRKAMTMVSQLGFPKERFHVLVNRVDKRDDIGIADMEKLFGCGVHASLPNDYFALHRVVTLGHPLGPENDLGRAIESVAQRLWDSLGGGKRQQSAIRDFKPALSHA
jgi:pilus assembly protein CpaE